LLVSRLTLPTFATGRDCGTKQGAILMLYVSYRHRQHTGRELVLCDGAPFPIHLHRDEWYLHGTHRSVSGRTEADIAKLGFCDRLGGVSFGRRVAAPHRFPLAHKAAS
jgi:hypothetical protein